MVSYIIRRLFAAVGVVIVISIITFAIFYLIPRIAGATPESMAARYVGKSPTPGQLQAAAESLGFYDPIAVQYWDWLKGVFVGKDVITGTGVDHCPAPCLGYSYKTSQPVLPRDPETFPGHPVPGGRCGDHLAGHGHRHRRPLRAQARLLLRPVRP